MNYEEIIRSMNLTASNLIEIGQTINNKLESDGSRFKSVFIPRYNPSNMALTGERLAVKMLDTFKLTFNQNHKEGEWVLYSIDEYPEHKTAKTAVEADNLRLQCLELASKLKTSDGQPMRLKELLDKAEELFNFIQKK